MKTTLALMALTATLLLSAGPARSAPDDQDWYNLRGRQMAMRDSITDRSDTTVTYFTRDIKVDTSWTDTVTFSKNNCRYLISWTWKTGTDFESDSTKMRIWPFAGDNGSFAVWDFITSAQPFFQGDTTDTDWDGVAAVINTFGVLDSASVILDNDNVVGTCDSSYVVVYPIPCSDQRKGRR
jgi:hypothetical protein